jgi:hypothetical protein
MALEYYASIDLNKNELQNAVVHPLGSAPSSPTEGQIYYDSTGGDKQIYVYNGSSWVALGGNKFDTIAVSGQTSVVADGTNDTLTFAAGSNVTITTDAGTDTITIASTNTQLSNEQVQDIVGGMVTGNTETGITVTYDDAGNSLDFVVASQTDENFTTALKNKLDGIEAGADVTDTTNVTAAGALMDSELTSITDVKALNQSVVSGAAPTFSTANMTDTSNKRFMTDAQETKLDSVETNADVTDTANVKAALNANLTSLTIGDSDDTITIPGDLVVTGTTTTNNVETVSTSNGVVFEGNAADANEVTLLAATVTADRTATLPDLTGHVALFSAAPTATVSATPAELNILDGVTATTAEINKLDGLTATTTELNYTDGVTSNIQTQLNAKAGSLSDLGVTATAAELNKLDGATVTTAEINILDGVTATATEINLLDGLTVLSGSNTGDEPNASTSTRGIVELATSAETQTGTDATRAVTPDGLAARSVTAAIDVTNPSFITNKYAEITHNLGTEDVIVEIFDVSTKQTVMADVARTDKLDAASTSKVKISFGVVPPNNIGVIITSAKGATVASVAYA